jgi:predicted SAM-dependent methyltransferase
MNLGCGPDVVEGWVNVDNAWNRPGVQCADMRVALPFDSATFDGILMNHSLQQVRHTEVRDVLVECRRILRPGGALRIIVPDVVAAFRAAENMDLTWPGFEAIEEPMNVECKLTRYLTWNGTNMTCFTLGALGHELAFAGFTFVAIGSESKIDGLDALDTRQGESLIVEAYK